MKRVTSLLPMTTFLTMKEAAQQIGRSPSSIRRIIYPIIAEDKHADRGHVAPSVSEVKALRMKGENFAWKISKDLLKREFPGGAAAVRATAKPSDDEGNQATARLLAMLQGELTIKNEQIAAQLDVIKGLNERLREENILFGTLQQQMRLGDGASRGGGVVDTPSAPAKTKPNPSKKSKPARGFFRRIFHV